MPLQRSVPVLPLHQHPAPGLQGGYPAAVVATTIRRTLYPPGCAGCASARSDHRQPGGSGRAGLLGVPGGEQHGVVRLRQLGKDGEGHGNVERIQGSDPLCSIAIQQLPL